MEENDVISNISSCPRNHSDTKPPWLITDKNGVRTVAEIIHSRTWIQSEYNQKEVKCKNNIVGENGRLQK